MSNGTHRSKAWIRVVLVLGMTAILGGYAYADEDSCNATIVTDDGSMTAQDLCDMIADSGKNVTVFHSQCYGGDVTICCNNASGAGCHNSGGSSGEVQYYGEYDQGTADALEPGATAGEIHQSGADNTSNSTPIDGNCSGTVGEDDTVITFAGDPNDQDHDMAQQISDQNDNTVNLEGDGTAEGVEGAATAEELEDAIDNADSDDVWIWISDHGNKGGPSSGGLLEPGTFIDLILTLAASVIDDMWNDPGDTAWIFFDSPGPFPTLLEVEFNGYSYTIPGWEAKFHEIGGREFYRYLLPVPEETVDTVNFMRVSYPPDGEPLPDELPEPVNAQPVEPQPLPIPTMPFMFETFVDSGPIAKPE